MKRIGLVMLALVAVFALAGASTGSDCNVVRFRSAPTYSTHAGYGGSYFPAAVYHPTYSYSLSSYSDPNPVIEKMLAALERSHDTALKAEREKVEMLKALIQSGAADPDKLKSAFIPPHKGAILMRESCVRCHSQEDGAAKGDKHIFFAKGELLPDVPVSMLYEAVVKKKTMPRGVKWTAEDRLEWVDYMTTLPPPPVAKAEVLKTDPKKTPKGDME